MSKTEGLIVVYVSSFVSRLFQAPHNKVTYELNHDFFAINPESGIIRLKRSLLGSGTKVYRVN